MAVFEGKEEFIYCHGVAQHSVKSESCDTADVAYAESGGGFVEKAGYQILDECSSIRSTQINIVHIPLSFLVAESL